jgi:aminodeoxyfutalosine synthase
MTLTSQPEQDVLSLLQGAGDPELERIAHKVFNTERLTAAEGLFLAKTENSEFVIKLADYARRRRVGDTVYYATTLYIHPTNLCELSCPLCSFYAKPGWDTAWFMTPEQVEEKVRKHYSSNVTEIHVVGGLWRDCDLDYYKDMFTRIKNIDSNLHIKALTPVEYDFLAKLHNISIEEVFERMMSWGLGSLPGGGAEILVEKIRKQIAPQKITSDEYLAVHRIAHSLGLPSNITMLFGHVEEWEDIITHLCKVRELQDDTGLFQTFVPLKYHDENNALGKRKHRLKPKNLKLVYALSRLMLDGSVRNIKVLWNYVGVDESLEILNCGANDLASTALDEKIIIMAGGVQLKMTAPTMKQLIEGIGRLPKEIHSGYDYKQDDPHRGCELHQ